MELKNDACDVDIVERLEVNSMYSTEDEEPFAMFDDEIKTVKEGMKGENKRMRVYLSGAITGTDDFMERFKAVEDRLANEGMSVINPASAVSYMPEDTEYEEYMKLSFCMLDMCEGIYMMDGWEKSCGANREYGYALAAGKTVMFENGDGKELWKD